MYAHSPALHPPEPGHLALGELVYGHSEVPAHFPIAELAEKIARNEFIFKTIVDEILRLYPLHKCPHLLDHPLFQAGIQTRVDAGIALLAAYERPYVEAAAGQEGAARNRVLLFVYGYLQGTYQALAAVAVGAVVQGLERRQPRRQGGVVVGVTCRGRR